MGSTCKSVMASLLVLMDHRVPAKVRCSILLACLNTGAGSYRLQGQEVNGLNDAGADAAVAKQHWLCVPVSSLAAGFSALENVTMPAVDAVRVSATTGTRL
jgi:predicted ABC-type transport system involved in lysophospholipase L1 biosynthesis ATPase subunit